MAVRLAVHLRPGGFSDRWTDHCRARGIVCEPVDGFDSNIIERLCGFDGFLWHFDHVESRDMLVAPMVLEAAESIGLEVFPNRATRWHFDNKLSQKYLLEGLGAPLAKSEVFYSEDAARAYVATATLPLVAKLKAGSGSANVQLLRSTAQAEAYCKKMFGAGENPLPSYFSDASTRVRSVAQAGALIPKLKRAPAALRRRLMKRRFTARERGYVYFQEFLPGNEFDTRITVVGDTAWGFIRRVRPGDFRASGSRDIDYDLQFVDKECVRIAFQTAERLGSQSTAFDFVKTPDGEPKIVEISYGYESGAVYAVSGQWRRDLSWQDGQLYAEDVIIDNLVAAIETKKG